MGSLGKRWFILIWITIIIATFNISVHAFSVSSPFGWRSHPITGKWHFHTGMDIPANHGTPIVALFDGEVVWAGDRRGYGNTVLLRHTNQKYTLYGHCAKLCVKPRQKVKAGDLIATVGSTGVSTGPHLHLEYWVNNQYVDPMLIWQAQTRQAEASSWRMNQNERIPKP